MACTIRFSLLMARSHLSTRLADHLTPTFSFYDKALQVTKHDPTSHFLVQGEPVGPPNATAARAAVLGERTGLATTAVRNSVLTGEGGVDLLRHSGDLVLYFGLLRLHVRSTARRRQLINILPRGGPHNLCSLPSR